MASNIVSFPGKPVRPVRSQAIAEMLGVLNSATPDGERPGAADLEAHALSTIQNVSSALREGEIGKVRVGLVMAELAVASLANALRRATGEQPAGGEA